MKNLEKILKLFKSICPDCLGKTHIVASNGNINLCTKCNGKGYQTIKELEQESFDSIN